MSAKSLSHTMREVSIRGPHDTEIWSRLLSRADMIAHSFNPKQTALVVNSLARMKSSNFRAMIESPDLINPFMTRFDKKFLASVIQHSSALDIAQIAHGFEVLGTRMTSRNFSSLLAKITQLASHMDTSSVSMCALALSHETGCEDDKVKCLEALVSRIMGNDQINEQCLAQMLRACATVPGQSRIVKIVEEMCMKNLPMIETMSIRGLCVCLNSLAKLKMVDRPVVNEIIILVADRVDREDSAFRDGASILQVGLLLRSLQKLGVQSVAPILEHRLVQYIRMRNIETNMSSKAICLLVSALTQVSQTEDLVVSFIRRKRNDGQIFSPTEIAALSSALKTSRMDPNIIESLIRDVRDDARTYIQNPIHSTVV